MNNRTQAVVCDDLGMSNYAVYNNPKAELKTKDRADLLEAFIGALYVDQVNNFFCLFFIFYRLFIYLKRFCHYFYAMRLTCVKCTILKFFFFNK